MLLCDKVNPANNSISYYQCTLQIEVQNPAGISKVNMKDEIRPNVNNSIMFGWFLTLYITQ